MSQALKIDQIIVNESWTLYFRVHQEYQDKENIISTEQNTTDLFTRVDNNFINNKDLNIIISSPTDISCNFTFAYIKGSESIVFFCLND